jgi:hypothetical protein
VTDGKVHPYRLSKSVLEPSDTDSQTFSSMSGTVLKKQYNDNEG